jgi:hypothetical protein
VEAHRRAQAVLPRRSRRSHRRQDPAAGGVQLLVARAGRAQRELVHAVADEACVGMTVNEAGNGAQPPSVDLGDVAVQAPKVAHPSHGRDRCAVAEDVGVLEHLHVPKRRSPQWSSGSRRSGELREIAEEQAAPAARGAHPRSEGCIGASSPCAAAVATASG